MEIDKTNVMNQTNESNKIKTIRARTRIHDVNQFDESINEKKTDGNQDKP